MINKSIYFSELTETQIEIMSNRAVTACIKYADEIGMTEGLSQKSHDIIYTTIKDTIRNEIGYYLENSKYLKPIKDLELTVRSINCLHSEGCFLTGDITNPPIDLRAIPGLGYKSLKDIRIVMLSRGIDIDETFVHWNDNFIIKKRLKILNEIEEYYKDKLEHLENLLNKYENSDNELSIKEEKTEEKS